MPTNYLNTLGLCARARKVVTGETIFTHIRKKTAYVVIIASDASANTKKKFVDKCTYYEIPYYFMGSTEEISKAIGKNNRVAVAITDKGFANMLKLK